MVIISLMAAVIAYLFGSLSSAIIVCKLMRLPDPRTQGSFNPGATNVLRIGGKIPAILTLAGDILKGVIPVLIATWLGLPSLGLALVTLAAFIGHLYPVFFHFQGGKGVATLLGCLMALTPVVALWWMGTWLVTAILFRYSSLAALTATMLSPFYCWYFEDNFIYVIMLVIIAAVLAYRHRGNIKKLREGTESKIGV